MLIHDLQRVLCAVLVLSVHSTALRAQLKSDTITGKVHQIKEVTVNGNIRKEAQSSTPMQVLRKEQFTQKGITDFSDALRRFTGVNIKDYGGMGGIKTISVRSLGAGHTSVSYDGIKVSNCQTGQIDLSSFTLENVESMTLLISDNNDIFVPASQLAAAATLNIKTTTPDFSAKNTYGSILLTTGSFGLASGNVRLNHQFNERFSFSTLLDGLRADNLYSFTLTNGSLVTQEKRLNNSIWKGRSETNFYYKPTNHSSLNAKIYYDVNSRALPGAVVLYNATSKEHLKEKTFFTQAQFKTYWDNNLSLQLNGKFNWANSHYRDIGGKYSGGEWHDIYYQREYYGSAALLYTPFKCWSFSYAADYSFNNLSTNAIDDTKPFRHTLLQGVNVKYEHLSWKATATLLSSNYWNDAKNGESSTNQHHLSPSISLSWKPFEEKDFYIRGSYKDIFRVATFTENYFTQMGNRNLLPESTKQFNLGVTYQGSLGNKFSFVSFSIDGYHNEVKDKIVAMPYNTFYWTMVNLGKVDIWGTDVNLQTTVQLSKQYAFQFACNYTYQYAVDITEESSSYYKDQIAYTPKHSGGASFAFENPIVNLSLHGTAISNRYRVTDNTPDNRIDGYIECGAAIYKDFHLFGTEMNLRGDIINMLDKQYEVIKNYPMPGRSFKITLKINL